MKDGHLYQHKMFFSSSQSSLMPLCSQSSSLTKITTTLTSIWLAARTWKKIKFYSLYSFLPGFFSCNMFKKLIYVVSSISKSCFYCWTVFCPINVSQFPDRHLCCFQFWLLQSCLRTFLYKSFCACVFSFLLGVCGRIYTAGSY